MSTYYGDLYSQMTQTTAESACYYSVRRDNSTRDDEERKCSNRTAIKVMAHVYPGVARGERDLLGDPGSQE